jgi:uncharacterized membrane protein YphA (DoxX/SURF4 family)
MSLKDVARHRYLAFLLRLALAAVFLWAGYGKAMDPHGFGVEIARYRMVPHDLLNAMAIMLPWIELVCGVTLVLGLWVRAGALTCGGMLVVFIIAIVLALKRGLDISCGCFGGGAESSHLSLATLWRDVFWLAWAAHVWFFDEGVLGLDAWLARRRISKGVAA